MNNRRIEIIQKDNRTRSHPYGALIIDDVACKESKSATKIEVAKVQYSGSKKDLESSPKSSVNFPQDKEIIFKDDFQKSLTQG